MKMKQVFILGMLTLAVDANATNYFVEDTKASIASPKEELDATTLLIKNKVIEHNASVTDSKSTADFVLKPLLIKLGSAYVLTIEKQQKGTRIAFADGKARTVEELDKAVTKATDDLFLRKQTHPLVPRDRDEEKDQMIPIAD